MSDPSRVMARRNFLRQASAAGAAMLTPVVYSPGPGFVEPLAGSEASAREFAPPEMINVKDYGATGDGSTNDSPFIQNAIAAAFGTVASPNSRSHPELNKILFFPNGTYRIASELEFPALWGGKIVGSGRQSSKIFADTNVNGFVFNEGIAYSSISDLGIRIHGEAVALFLDWNNNPAGATNQANHFECLLFENTSAGHGIGVQIAASGNDAQGDTSLFLNCQWVGFDIGIRGDGLNAIGNEIVGGNFQSNNTAILNTKGTIKSVVGTDFQNGDGWDIDLQGGVADTVVISGVRTESKYFVRQGALHGGQIPIIVGCNQLPSDPQRDDVFFQAGADGGTIIGCLSSSGQIVGFSTNWVWRNPVTTLLIESSQFGRNDWASEAVIAYLKSVRVGLTVQGQGTGAAVNYGSGTYFKGTFFPDEIASGLAIPFIFSDSPRISDPGAGNIRLNNADLSLVTSAAVSDNSAIGQPGIVDFLFFNGFLILRKVRNPNDGYGIYEIIDFSAKDGWTELTLNYVKHNGSLSNAHMLIAEFSRGPAMGKLSRGANTVRKVRVATAVGSVIVGDDDDIIVIKALGASIHVMLPKAAARTRPITIKDGKGDADIHNITVTPDGSETIDGASSRVLNSATQSLTVYPYPDGLGWFIL